jgi:hypothetical protein
MEDIKTRGSPFEAPAKRSPFKAGLAEKFEPRRPRVHRQLARSKGVEVGQLQLGSCRWNKKSPQVGSCARLTVKTKYGALWNRGLAISTRGPDRDVKFKFKFKSNRDPSD